MCAGLWQWLHQLQIPKLVGSLTFVISYKYIEHYCHCLIVLDKPPKLHELDRIEVNGKTVKVLEGAGNKWDKIATRLHFEHHRISQIWTESQNNTERACCSVFGQWLDGKEGLRTPRTWRTVIKVLRESDLGQLADDLKEVLHEKLLGM